MKQHEVSQAFCANRAMAELRTCWCFSGFWGEQSLADQLYLCLTLCFFLTSSSFFAVLFFLQFVYPCPHCIQSASSTSSQSFSRLPGSDPPAYPLPHSASKPFLLCSCLCLCTCLFSLASTSLQYPFWVSALTEFNSMPSSRLVVPHDFMPRFLA